MFDALTVTGIFVAAVVGAIIWHAYSRCRRC